MKHTEMNSFSEFAMGESDPSKDSSSRLDSIKYYASMFLGTLCIVCVFAFLFLVPFILDPAISTLMHEFVDTPVHCKVNHQFIKELKSYFYS